MGSSLLIKNALIVYSDEVLEANIFIENGVIRSVSRIAEPKADEVVNADHRLAISGGIDIHAHVYDPNHLDHEDWRTGSLAAAYGGLTTIYDMPLRTIVDNKDVLKNKIEAASKESYINYGIIGGFINEKNIDSIPILAENGVSSYKIFTTKPFKPDETYYGVIFEKISSVNGVAIIHAEDDSLVYYGERHYREYDDPVSYHLHRSPYAEAAAIIRVGYVAHEVGARIHIAHLSSGEGVEALKWLKNKGFKLTAETCPHYLYFTRDDVDKHGSLLKVAPTLKTPYDREALWNALENGVIDVYASDNAPSPRSLKMKNIWEAWGGIPNLEIMVPFLYTYGVLKRRISLERMIDLVSRNPAKVMGIYPWKGELCIGCDADIVIIDTGKPIAYRSEKHHHKVDWSPWDGVEFYGIPLHVIVNGEIMIKDRELIGKPGRGKFVQRKMKK